MRSQAADKSLRETLRLDRAFGMQRRRKAKSLNRLSCYCIKIVLVPLISMILPLFKMALLRQLTRILSLCQRCCTVAGAYPNVVTSSDGTCTGVIASQSRRRISVGSDAASQDATGTTSISIRSRLILQEYQSQITRFR